MVEDIGQCKWRYAIVDGIKTDIRDAKRCQHGICPMCGDELIARKGEVRAHHWWHVRGKCDDWYQPKGPWHIYWQSKFPVEMQEVPVSRSTEGGLVKHIADIRTGSGLVIEVQYSAIMPAVVKERELFYGKMLWLISKTRFPRFAEVSSKWGRFYRCGEFDVWGLDGKHQQCLPRAWEKSDKFLWLDCHGSMEHPESDEDLVCVVPRAQEDAFRLYTYVSREKFLKMCYDDTFKPFEEELLAYRDKYRAEFGDAIDKEENAASEKKRKAKLRKEWRELEEDYEREKREECQRRIADAVSLLRDKEQEMDKTVVYENWRHKEQLRTINDFIWEAKEALPQIRMELPWLKLWALAGKYIFSIPMGDLKADGLCRAELCLKNGYGSVDYDKDLEELRSVLDEPALAELPQFEKLRPYEGKVMRVGLVQPDLSGEKALLRFNKLEKPKTPFAQ